MGRSEFASIAKKAAGTPFVEAYALLLVNVILGRNGDPTHVVAFTAARSGDGVTTTVANLGQMMAQTGRKVVVVDTNLRAPALHQAFGVPEGPGLAEVLSGQKRVAEVSQPSKVANLTVVAAGKATVPPHALLQPGRLEAVIAALRETHDFVLLDTPPVLRYPDTLTVARAADGVVLVVPAGATSRRTHQEARRRLERVDARIIGAVLNRVPPREAVLA
jgi:capsular exopolysaccharide synthesis family protein